MLELFCLEEIEIDYCLLETFDYSSLCELTSEEKSLYCGNRDFWCYDETENPEGFEFWIDGTCSCSSNSATFSLVGLSPPE